jgi:tripartite motif-containing protein 71
MSFSYIEGALSSLPTPASSSSFLPNLTFVKLLSQEGNTSSDIQILQPEGVDVDSEGNFYINDIVPNRILKFSKNGTYIMSWGSTGSGDGHFNHPHGNEIDLQGNVYITDQGNSRVQKFTSNGTFITKWGSEGSGDGQFSMPESIDIDSFGHVYVADTDDNNVQLFIIT